MCLCYIVYMYVIVDTTTIFTVKYHELSFVKASIARVLQAQVQYCNE